MADTVFNNLYSAMIKTSLRVSFIVHFFLISLACGSWHPQSYVLYNTFFLITLLWSIHSITSEDAVYLSLIINLGSVILDVIILAVYFPPYNDGYHRFSVSFSILNLVIRPVSCVGLYRIWNERSNPDSAAAPTSYETIDG